jgi:hypothetical protein
MVVVKAILAPSEDQVGVPASAAGFDVWRIAVAPD